MSLLEFDNVTLRFGGVTAIDRLSFSVEEGEVFAIVGPNGAGKSTAFNLISRLYDPAEGRITFDGTDLLARGPDAVAKLGIARTFQNIELFEQATVLENLLVGRHRFGAPSLLSELLFLPSLRRSERVHREAVERAIDFLNLQPYRHSRISSLAYGVRKVVELARAVAMEPRLIMLDEPSSGLSPEETQDLVFWVQDMRDHLGMTVIMVEHDMHLVSTVSDRVLALADGRQLALGTPPEVQSHPKVIEAYLGADEDAAA
ncbi:ABC transporter ATP-binding protein [Chachezhania sediminis]|uniref:ABC transporter ATP-binding protein n=1 Tax=Chachezhania sediminis TaxID=2599291 RepID=UPI00131BE2E5|nr:ABC transporter ATP-binding protein [Chachezhania sediminis]